MDKEVSFTTLNTLAIDCLSTWHKCNLCCCFIHITGDILVDVIDEVAPDLSEFISSKIVDSSSIKDIGDGVLVCENVTLSLDYKLYWNKNGIISVILTRTVGTINISKNGMYLYCLPIICTIIIIHTVLHCFVYFWDSGVKHKVLCNIFKWTSDK